MTDVDGRITTVDQMLATNSISSWIAGAGRDVPTRDGMADAEAVSEKFRASAVERALK